MRTHFLENTATLDDDVCEVFARFFVIRSRRIYYCFADNDCRPTTCGLEFRAAAMSLTCKLLYCVLFGLPLLCLPMKTSVGPVSAAATGRGDVNKTIDSNNTTSSADAGAVNQLDDKPTTTTAGSQPQQMQLREKRDEVSSANGNLSFFSAKKSVYPAVYDPQQQNMVWQDRHKRAADILQPPRTRKVFDNKESNHSFTKRS